MAWMTSAQLEKRQSVGNCYYCLWEDGVYVRATVANGNRWCCEAHA